MTPTVTPTAPGGSTGVLHHHLDHLGSVQVITKPDGGVFEYIRYKAYGEVRGHYNADGSSQTVNTCGDDAYCHEFTGYDTEPISGLQYAGARVYDPALGMFLTHDPVRQFVAMAIWNRSTSSHTVPRVPDRSALSGQSLRAERRTTRSR